MRLLLDTHVLLWWIGNDPALGAVASEAIADQEATVFISAAAAWEIAIKRALGKLKAPSDLEAKMELHRFESLPITIAHATAAGALPPHHKDPFDRMLVAQAISEQLTIVTRDPRISLYEVETLPA